MLPNAHRHFCAIQVGDECSPQIVNLDLANEQEVEFLSAELQKRFEILEKSNGANQVAKKSTFVMAGIHPWSVENGVELNKSIEQLDFFASRKAIDGIGEVGIDATPKHCQFLEEQIECLRLQIEIANRYNLPVTFHALKPYAFFSSFFKECKVEKKIIFHSFSGSIEEARELSKKSDCYFSFSPTIFFRKASSLKALKEIEIDRLLLEDEDENFNAAEFSLFYERVAKLRALEESFLIETVAKNLREIFNLQL